MNITRVGVDIAKSVFHVHAVDRHGSLVWQAKLKRNGWLTELSERLMPGAEVGIEACASSHHWARELQKRGYRVKLIAAQFVKPYVKSNKNDLVDAEAICEAMSRPGMRFVAVKSVGKWITDAGQVGCVDADFNISTLNNWAIVVHGMDRWGHIVDGQLKCRQADAAFAILSSYRDHLTVIGAVGGG